jgi:hypothetical protein
VAVLDDAGLLVVVALVVYALVAKAYVLLKVVFSPWNNPALCRITCKDTQI